MKPRHSLLALLAALAASAPARAATVGPIEPLPAAQAIGREAFPVDPIGRTWTYRRPDGTSVERGILPPGGPCGTVITCGLWACRERVIVTSPSPKAEPRLPAAYLEVQGCTEGLSVGLAGWVGSDGACTDTSGLEKSVMNPRYSLRSNRKWTAPSWTDTNGGAVASDQAVRPSDTSYRVLGKARVEVLAGTFPMTAVVESTPSRHDAPPARRVFYAANVGPVLEQVKDAAGAWVTDLELESYEAKPTSVVVSTDSKLAGRDDHHTAVPAPTGAAAPSHAEIGPLEPIPDGANIGAEIFPLGLRDLTWRWSRPRDGSSDEMIVVTDRDLVRTLPHSREPCAGSAVAQDAVVFFPGGSMAARHYYACSDRIEFRFDGGLERWPVTWMPLPIAANRSWTTDVADPGEINKRVQEVYAERPHRVLGRAQVVTPAGRFEKAVGIETSEPARDGVPERAVRRTYYAANVGPVLVLVPEGDRWVTDLVLEALSIGSAEPAQQRAATGAAPTKHAASAAEPAQHRAASGAAPTDHAAPAAEPVRQRAATGAGPTKRPNAGAGAQ